MDTIPTNIMAKDGMPFDDFCACLKEATKSDLMTIMRLTYDCKNLDYTRVDRLAHEYRLRLDIPTKIDGTKHDTGKPRMDLIPPEVQVALGTILEYGARKYADRNWELGFAWGRSTAALKRHLTAWEAGQDRDPESGLPHLWHVLTNAGFLVTFEARGIGTDDRPQNCALSMWGPKLPEAQCNPECA